MSALEKAMKTPVEQGNGTDAGRRLRVLGETAYPLSTPAARVRLAAYAPFLRVEGVTLECRFALSDPEYETITGAGSPLRKVVCLGASAVRAVGRPRPAHDLLLIQRLGLLTPLPLVDPPRHLDVYDFDDALYLPDAPTLNSRFGWAKQEARRCREYVRRARLVTAGNEFLAAFAREHARRVELVPTCVDPAVQPMHAHEPSETVVVGWIGSRSTSEYLRPVLPAFERLNSQALRAKLVLVGADPALEAPWIEHRRWSLERERDDLAGFDIGIMPLPDSEWARGKCGYKLLQYFAAGVPAVASPVGVASAMIGDDRGIRASTSDEWHSALVQLVDDVAERRQRGAVARDFVERHYSYRRWAPELAAMLRSLSDEGG